MYVQRRFMPQQKQNICILATNEPSLSTQPQWWKCLTSHPFLSWPLCSNPALRIFVHQLIDRQQKVEQEICYYIATCTQNLQNFKETTHVTKHFQPIPNCPNHCHPFSPHDITIMPSSRDLRSFQFKVSQVAERCLQQNDFWDDGWPPYTDHEAVKKGGLPGELKNV